MAKDGARDARTTSPAGGVVVNGTACLVGMGLDITERQRNGDRLAESERKYRELVEHANSIILRWNADGHITFLNEFGQRFFGYSAAEDPRPPRHRHGGAARSKAAAAISSA